ncbi:MAG: fatty acid desaturase [Proteobacteria bacterium]|nr:fatty acid desaturase [Pseudomonadota bacterium]
MNVIADEREVFAAMRRDLRDSQGRDYVTARRQLRPLYGRVWMEIGAAYGVIVGVLAGLGALDGPGTPWSSVIGFGLAGGLLIGYAINFLSLWFHEAAHFNIHRKKSWNDRLANVLLGPLVMQDIRHYRLVHFRHHGEYGEITDPERSYFQPLDLRFVAASLLGIAALRTLRLRHSVPTPVGRWMPAVGSVLHGVVVVLGLLTAHFAVSLAWMFAIGAVFPFLGAVRQLLEHRQPDADDAADYSRQPHGAYTRVFGDGPLASTLGGAGFNRHLIHHWDANLSSTRFREMERFLEDTALGDFYRGRKTTYGRTFRELFRPTLARPRSARAQPGS